MPKATFGDELVGMFAEDDEEEEEDGPLKHWVKFSGGGRLFESLGRALLVRDGVAIFSKIISQSSSVLDSLSLAIRKKTKESSIDY